jgi:chemotaxis protein CheY-P-specific phosphatase CheC
MKKSLTVLTVCWLVLSACRKKEEVAAPPSAPALAKKVVTANPEPPPPAGTPHSEPWSIPPRGVVLWLVGNDAKAEYGGGLASWSNPYLPGVTAVADRTEMKPAVVQDAMNGHAAVRFDGLSNMMQTNIDISPAQMPVATVFVAFNSKTDAASPLRKLYGDDDGGYDRAVGLDNRAGSKNFAVFTGSGVEGEFVLKANEPYVIADEYTKTEFSSWVNGKETLQKINASWGSALPNMYIGGTGPVNHEPWQGDIAEVVVYSRRLSELERMQVEDYLAKKYGVALKR